MPAQQFYKSPCNEQSCEFEEKKSRFITTIFPTNCREDALEKIQKVSRHHSRANHNCHGFIIGNPAIPKEMAASDDGEPSGTAGRPIINVLQQQAIGDTAIVVTRYFGGVKLGAGGLVRAYTRAVKEILPITVFREIRPMIRLELQFDFALEALVRATATSLCGTSDNWSYSHFVRCTVTIPSDASHHFTHILQEKTGGAVKIARE